MRLCFFVTYQKNYYLCKKHKIDEKPYNPHPGGCSICGRDSCRNTYRLQRHISAGPAVCYTCRHRATEPLLRQSAECHGIHKQMYGRTGYGRLLCNNNIAIYIVMRLGCKQKHMHINNNLRYDGHCHYRHRRYSNALSADTLRQAPGGVAAFRLQCNGLDIYSCATWLPGRTWRHFRTWPAGTADAFRNDMAQRYRRLLRGVALWQTSPVRTPLAQKIVGRLLGRHGFQHHCRRGLRPAFL